MTQHDYGIENQTFPAIRADINSALDAIQSENSGASTPSDTVAYMFWADTANGIFKQRNAADSAFLHMWTLGKQGLIDQDGSTVYAADAGSTDAYAITLTPAPTAYAVGQTFRFKANTPNTGAATLNVNGLGAKTIKKNSTSDLATNDILAAQINEVIYDGTNFQMLSAVAAGTTTITAVTARSSNTILGTGDSGGVFVFTSTFTQTFTPAATLGSKWYCFIHNDGTGVITLDPNSSETIDNVTTLLVYPGEAFMIICDGSNLKTVGRQSSGLVLLQSQTASSVASVDFTSFITSDFSEYIIEFDGVTPATDNVSMRGRVSFAGSFVTAANYGYIEEGMTVGGGGDTATSTDTSFPITTDNSTAAGARLGNAAGRNASGEIRLFNPSSTSLYKNLTWKTSLISKNGLVTRGNASGMYLGATTAIDGFRFFMSSGNIASGTFRLYGVRG